MPVFAHEKISISNEQIYYNTFTIRKNFDDIIYNLCIPNEQNIEEKIIRF